MRITNNMMVNTLMQDLQNSLALVQKYNKEAQGRRVHRPSDDPVATSKILKFSTDLSELEQYKSNISDADSLFKVTESSISEVSEVLKRLKDLAERAANETFTGEDHLKFQSEIKAIFDQLVTNANFNFVGKYIFSGFETDKPLMNKDGTYAVDVTDSQINGIPKLNLLVGSGERMAMSTHGFEIFGVVKDYGVFNNVIADTSGILPKNNKLTIMGKLNLNSNINGNIRYVIGNETFTAQISGMNGSPKLEVDRNVLLEKIKNAKNAGGTKKLGEVANVYFDSHDNLIVDVRDVPDDPIDFNKYKANTSLFHSATHFSGSPATTSETAGKFPLTGVLSNFTGLNGVEIKVEAGNYAPPGDAPDAYFIQKNGDNRISKLNGNVREITKDEIINLIKSSPNAAGTSVLSDRYDVFFDANDQLVIKLKATKDSDYGNRTINVTGFLPATFAPTTRTGKDTRETKSVFSGYVFNDDYVFKNSEKLEKDAIYIEYNGDKKRIVPSGVAVKDVATYVQGLQNTLNKEFGVGKVEVKAEGTAPNFHLTFETKNTKLGETPTLRIEATRVKESSLMRDIKDLITDLDKNDYEGVRKFLDKFHPHYDRVLAIRAEIGGKTRRLEFAQERMQDNKLAFTDMLSKQRDADFEQSITKFKNAEAIYHAALMMGSKIIQPSLLDFLR